MELVRRSLGSILRARVCWRPLQITASRAASRARTNFPLLDQNRVSPFILMVRACPMSTESIETDRVQTSAMTPQIVERQIADLERTLKRFEFRFNERESFEKDDFAHVFREVSSTIEKLDASGRLTDDIKADLAPYIATLLRYCGRAMVDSPPKVRELLAGDVWELGKRKNLPYDTSHYNNLIRCLNENNVVFDPKKILDEMIAANLQPDRITYQRLIHQYCEQGNLTEATSLLEKMKDQKLPLNELVFASLIIGYGKQEQRPSYIEMFELMRSNEVEPDRASYAAAMIVQIDQVSKDPTALDELKNLFELIELEEINFSTFETVDILTHLNKLEENELVSKIYDYLAIVMRGSVNNRRLVLRMLLENKRFSQARMFYWKYKAVLRLSEHNKTGNYYIKLLGMLDVPAEFAIEECKRIKEEQQNPKAFHVLYYNSAAFGNLDRVKAAMREMAREEPIICEYFWPLIVQAKNEDEVLEALKHDLFPRSNSASLFDTFAHWVWPKLFGCAARVFEANDELKIDTRILIASLLHYSMSEDKVKEVCNILLELKDIPMETKEQDSKLSEVMDDRFQRSTITQLNQIAEITKDPTLVKKIYNLCFTIDENRPKRPRQQASSHMTPLVKVHLLNDDLEAALKEFKEIVNKYNITTCVRPLLIKCLEAKDKEKLQEVVSILTNLHGESNALFDLAMSCLQSGRVKQAERILGAPGYRINPIRVYDFMSIFFRESKSFDVLEKYVKLTRDLYEVDQDRLYGFLIDAYEKTDNAHRALKLWDTMQDDDYRPSKYVMLRIANLLEAKNIAVPFQKPRGILGDYQQDLNPRRWNSGIQRQDSDLRRQNLDLRGEN